MKAPTKKKKENYLDNQKFKEALREYRDVCLEAKKRGEPKPLIPNYIGKSFMDMAQHMAQRPNFSGYTYRDDMVMDAVENCCVCVSNYDPDRGTSALSYYSQVVWYAFLRRISKEKRQTEVVDKIVSKSNFDQFFEGDGQGATSDYNSIVAEVNAKNRAYKKSK